MWDYIWFLVALCLGVYCWHWHREYLYSHYYYLSANKREVELLEKLYSLQSSERKFYLSQKLLATLLQPHPESVVIDTYFQEVYDGYSAEYTMYGDGKIIDTGDFQGNRIRVGTHKVLDKKPRIIWPKSKEHLSNIFGNDADLLWLYLELYHTFIKNNINIDNDDLELHDTFSNNTSSISYFASLHPIDISPSATNSYVPQYRTNGDNSPIIWINNNGKPAYTYDGQLFTQNIYEDWKRKADAGEF